MTVLWLIVCIITLACTAALVVGLARSWRGDRRARTSRIAAVDAGRSGAPVAPGPRR